MFKKMLKKIRVSIERRKRERERERESIERRKRERERERKETYRAYYFEVPNKGRCFSPSIVTPWIGETPSLVQSSTVISVEEIERNLYRVETEDCIYMLTVFNT